MTYHPKWATKFIDELFDAILLLKDKEECYRFFEDVCTIKELQVMSQRLQVAKLLRANKTYHEIENITGASTATISRVNKFLLYGPEGYNMILDRVDGIEGKNKKNIEENK